MRAARRLLLLMCLAVAAAACANNASTDADALQESDTMSKIVEIHVPLDPRPGLPEDDYKFPWIDEIEEFLAEQEEKGNTEVYDDGEELEGFYIFSITGGSERELLAMANKVAALPDIPEGAVAYVAENEDETFGQGRRVELPFAG